MLRIQLSDFLIKFDIQFFVELMRFELLFAYLLKKFLAVKELK